MPSRPRNVPDGVKTPAPQHPAKSGKHSPRKIDCADPAERRAKTPRPNARSDAAAERATEAALTSGRMPAS